MFKYGRQVLKGWITSISRGGAFIQARGKFPLGHKIKFVFIAPQTKAKVQHLGWIVRLDPEGFGLCFDRRSGTERRYDLDRRFGGDRRKKKILPAPGKKDR